MNKPIEPTTTGVDEARALGEQANRAPSPGRSVYAQRAATLAKDLDRLIDAVQALAAEVDDGRSFCLYRVADELTDAQDSLRRTMPLLGLAP